MILLKHLLIVLALSCCFCNAVSAQNNRLVTKERIGWYNLFGTVKLNSKFGIHAEYQWRRENYITNWQQSLFRTGLNYHPTKNVMFRVGYAWIETFPYGDIPLNALGRNFTEHRIFEMAQLQHKEGPVNISHRFMLEQRFVGRYSSANVEKEDQFPFTNRMRYMVRLQTPLGINKNSKNSPYIALYDEAMIGFGKNVNNNVFDQNRLGILLGHQLNDNVRIEAGYLNQIVQFGRQVNGKNVFQHNNGVILNALFNIDAHQNKNN